MNSKEVAQEYVYTGVGLLAGSSILLLTIVWGTCLIVGSQDLYNGAQYSILPTNSNSTILSLNRLLCSLTGNLNWFTIFLFFLLKNFIFFLQIHLIFIFYWFIGCGITTDQEASYTARIMVISVTPFLIIQLLKFIPSSSGKLSVILIALTISIVLLLLYFFYQVWYEISQFNYKHYWLKDQFVL